MGYRLRRRNILLLEKESVPGGRTVSRQLGDYVYNAGAQVIMGDASPVARLADELCVPRTLIRKTRVPLFFRGRLYSARSQPALLARLPLTLGDKARFALSAYRSARGLRAFRMSRRGAYPCFAAVIRSPCPTSSSNLADVFSPGKHPPLSSPKSLRLRGTGRPRNRM